MPPCRLESSSDISSCNAGKWHELARLLPVLARKGIDALAVQEATHLDRPRQNIWTVASQVAFSSTNADSADQSHFNMPSHELVPQYSTRCALNIWCDFP